MNYIQAEGIVEVIFHEKKYHNLGQTYLNLFYELDDDTVIPTFSIQTINFRFEFSNLTGSQIKNKINDYLFTNETPVYNKIN